MLVLGKYTNEFSSLLSEKCPQSKRITVSPSSLQDSQLYGLKSTESKNQDKWKDNPTTGQEMKNSFIRETMWGILYVGNRLFPKIEAGQNQFNNLGINIVAFLLTQSGQWRLFRSLKTKVKDSCPGCESIIHVMPQRQWSWHRISKGHLKNYFFRLFEKWKVCLQRC